MIKRKFNTGYSVETANSYVETEKHFVLVSEFNQVNKYDNESKSYTDEFSHNVAYFSQNGLKEPFKVKLNDIPKDVTIFSEVNLINLQAFENRDSVYFKADGVKKHGTK